MHRENRLAVFEHVPSKKQPTPVKNNSKPMKRSGSPKRQCEPKSNKRGKNGIYGAEEEFMFDCECQNCDYSTDKYYDFLQHLTEHVDDRKNDPELNLMYTCTWDKCTYSTSIPHGLRTHVTYHGYHSRLRAIGSSVLTRVTLPACRETDCSGRWDAQPERYTCEWDECDTALASYQQFLDHVKCHVNAFPKKSGGDHDDGDLIRCGWTGCSNTYQVQHKLLDHVRCHTKEKRIACPTCGAMFSCKTKFYDHRKRQLQQDLQGYQCAQCSKLFASERLLRDHMRIHINHYKCHLCDMTCTKPSTLAKHIRYRHLPERLFKCDVCNHSTITAQDLSRHKRTHNVDAKLECKKCSYTCRSAYTFRRHLKQHSGAWGEHYACHCCDQRFAMGAQLTKHLIHVHDFHWPNGHSRFSYKQDTQTGLYHLQVVRYESLEVTQEMMQTNMPYQFSTDAADCKFECVQNKPLSFVLKVANNQQQHVEDVKMSNTKLKCNNSNDAVITVTDVDGKGNIVQVQTIQTETILCSQDYNNTQYTVIQ